MFRNSIRQTSKFFPFVSRQRIITISTITFTFLCLHDIQWFFHVEVLIKIETNSNTFRDYRLQHHAQRLVHLHHPKIPTLHLILQEHEYTIFLLKLNSSFFLPEHVRGFNRELIDTISGRLSTSKWYFNASWNSSRQVASSWMILHIATLSINVY